MKTYLNKIKLYLLAALATVAPRKEFVPRMSLKQGGFVTLSATKGYAGYPAGATIELPASTEAALIASGQATASTGPVSTGIAFQSTNAMSGNVGIGAGGGSVTITNPNITVQSIVYAMISTVAADATATSVVRVAAAAGSVTIYLNANSTAGLAIDWAILNPNGSLSSPI